jgi:hypothetical protein
VLQPAAAGEGAQEVSKVGTMMHFAHVFIVPCPGWDNEELEASVQLLDRTVRMTVKHSTPPYILSTRHILSIRHILPTPYFLQ